MKRLLLGPALLAPLMLFSCNWHKPELPKVPEVVRQIPLDDFNAFPPVPTMPTPAPVVPARKPHATKPHQVKKHAPVGARHRPPVDRPAPADPLPPQQGPICIFPLNFIPNCTPQEAQ